MCVGRDRRCSVGLSEKVKGTFRLGKEFVPKFEREIICYPCKYAEEVQLEVTNGNFGGIVAMVAGWDKFKCHVVCVFDKAFHYGGDVIVQDMFARCDAGLIEAEH